jgi:hypothetical protein
MVKRVRIRLDTPISDFSTLLSILEYDSDLNFLYPVFSSVKEDLSYRRKNYVAEIGYELQEGKYKVDVGKMYQLGINVRKTRTNFYKIRCFPILEIPPFKLRAEMLNRKELDEQPSLSFMPIHLYDIVKSEMRNNLEMLGVRGVGKTFILMKMARKLVRETKHIVPIIYRFYGSSSVTLLDPEKYGSRKEWGKRYESISKMSPKVFNPNTILEEVSEMSNDWKVVLGLDDIHYMFEGVEKGEMNLRYLTDILKAVRDLPKNVSKILVTDDVLSCYAERFDDRDLENVIFDFGEITPRLYRELMIKDKRDEILGVTPNRIFVEPSYYTPFSILSIFKIKGIEDKRIEDFFDFATNRNPRKILKLAHEIINFLEEEKLLYQIKFLTFYEIETFLQKKVGFSKDDIRKLAQPSTHAETLQVYDKLFKFLET